jgi:hypothetical protein
VNSARGVALFLVEGKGETEPALYIKPRGETAQNICASESWSIVRLL